ncbi:MAG: lipid-A-disaccharide synthase [Opitutales bacterium]
MSKPSDIPRFCAPKDGAADILFIAGEHSGDQHAARLVRKLLAADSSLRIAAIGGPEMERAGAQLLFDLTAFSVVGFVEVLKHIGQLRALMNNSVEWIAAHRPRCVCFVDYPGFNLRLAQKLFDRNICRKAGGATALFYYISPQIWAWKAGRRFKMAKLLDAMAVIFPFELDCYADTSLPVRFVGHPFVSEGHSSNMRYDARGPVVLLPGSRVQAVSRIFPAMLAGFEELLRTRPEERALALYPDEAVRDALERALVRYPSAASRLELRAASKGAGAKACLISSGTMSLNCALAAIPGAVCYLAHPMSYLIGKRLIKVPHLGIANLLLPDAPPYPEYIQSAASPGALARELSDAIGNPARAERCAEAAALLRGKLAEENATDAAGWLLEVAGFAQRAV